jgi:hypothetical protein
MGIPNRKGFQRKEIAFDDPRGADRLTIDTPFATPFPG